MKKIAYSSVRQIIKITINLVYTDEEFNEVASSMNTNPKSIKKKYRINQEKLDILNSIVESVKHSILYHGFHIKNENESNRSHTYYIQFYYGEKFVEDESILVIFRLGDHKSKSIQDETSNYRHIIIHDYRIDDRVIYSPLDFEKVVDRDCETLRIQFETELKNQEIKSAIQTAPIKVNGKLVNQVGEFLRKQFKDAYKIEKQPNQYEIYFHLIYQWKYKEGYEREDPDVHDLNVSINLTCYQDKLRINFMDRSGYGKVLGSWVIPADKLVDVHNARTIIFNKIMKRLEKLFGTDYDYVF